MARCSRFSIFGSLSTRCCPCANVVSNQMCVSGDAEVCVCVEKQKHEEGTHLFEYPSVVMKPRHVNPAL